MGSNDEVERRGVATTLIERSLSKSSTPSFASPKMLPRDRSNRLLGPNLALRLNAYTINSHDL